MMMSSNLVSTILERVAIKVIKDLLSRYKGKASKNLIFLTSLRNKKISLCLTINQGLKDQRHSFSRTSKKSS